MADTVLVVDDEEDMLDLLRFNLEREGYVVRVATSGLAALRLAADERPDVIILDRMLPGIDGIGVTGALRATSALATVPVLMLTARGSEDDRVSGFDGGVDDYLVKPFAMRELLARLRALLRRTQTESAAQETLAFATIRFDGNRRLVVCDGGAPVALTPKEGALLELFLRNPERYFSRDEIIAAVWEDAPEDSRAVDVLVRRLRGKLGAQARLLSTLPGRGYGLIGASAPGGKK